jgi:hypothetical protein
VAKTNLSNPPTFKRACSVENCGKKHFSLGYCNTHYYRFKRNGDPSRLRGQGNPVITADDFQKCLKLNKKTGCLEWTRGKTGQGYGNLKFRGKYWRAHRVAWLFAYGYEPKLMVRHDCDNPPCCNPAHLRLGTQAQNMRDVAGRNRNPKPKIQLEEQQIAALQRAKDRLDGKTIAELAREFGIARSTAYRAAGCNY